MTWCTNYKEMVSLQYELFNASSNCHPLKMTWYTDHNDDIVYASSHHQLDEVTQDTDPKEMFSLQYLSFKQLLTNIFVYAMLLQISTQEKCL